MSLELIDTFATLGTFVFIAATAIVAMSQLRHARSSNQIAALNELREAMETPEFQAATEFVLAELPARMREPAFRYQLAERGARNDETRPLCAKVQRIGNFYESLGTLMKAGLVDTQLALELWCTFVVQNWETLGPAAAVIRRKEGDGFWENFEYAAVLAQDWIAAHPKGTYPADVRRIALNDDWIEADRQYAASLASA
jgi:hypothetical protein